MFFKLFYALAMLTCRGSVYGHTPDALDDEITEMPGLKHDPGFRQFSGYLHISDTDKYIFYWYVESQSSPEHDPVAYWTNGGPGCSGLYGFGTEMGPYYFRANGTIEANPYSWNKISNMLFVEQPAGVGFSYSNNPDDYNTNDKQAAIDQYELILAFFERFPERKSNEFYITSESYGGHYMPQLALTILKEKESGDNDINFKGFAVGNPWAHPSVDVMSMYEMYYYHGVTPQPIYDRWLAHNCNDFKKRDQLLCPTIEGFFLSFSGYGINPYALDYPMCVEDEETDSINNEFLKSFPGTKDLWSPQGAQLLLFSNPHLKMYVDNYEPCAEDYFKTYLNRKDVQKAIHAIEPEGEEWHMCNLEMNAKWSIKDRYSSQVKNYQNLIKGDYGIKMLVFSGDDDSVCATTGTQKWVFHELGLEPQRLHYWKKWHVNDQEAGYVTKFEIPSDESNSTFLFATVHGAGHEVPAYKPEEAFDLWERYLTGDWNFDDKGDENNILDKFDDFMTSIV